MIYKFSAHFINWVQGCNIQAYGPKNETKCIFREYMLIKIVWLIWWKSLGRCVSEMLVRLLDFSVVKLNVGQR